MKTIKIAYRGWWNGFDYHKYIIQEILEKYYDVEIVDNPDYIFYSIFGKVDMPEDAIAIEYIGENLCPDFNVADYAIGFENMEFYDRYLYMPNWLMNPIYRPELSLMCEKHHQSYDEKQEFCSFVYSNADADTIRELFFKKLCNYKVVNSGGRYLNNIGVPNGVPNKLEFQQKHKFSIAFENSSHIGYTTEKIVQCFAAGTIPIYWGNPNVTDIFNEKAFINVHDFENLDQVVEKIREIDQNDILYNEMLHQPALKDDKFIIQKQEKLESFLRNIIEQEKQQAVRKTLGIWGERYRHGKCDKTKNKRFFKRRRKQD